jgi:hypothetical protein
MLTRKHFQAIADSLASQRPNRAHETYDVLYIAKLSQWNSLTLSLAHTLSLYNPAFDRERFLRACVYTPSENA